MYKFLGHAVEILFCILYTRYAPYEGEQGFGALIVPRCQSLQPLTSCKDPMYGGMPGLGILPIFPRRILRIQELNIVVDQG